MGTLQNGSDKLYQRKPVKTRASSSTQRGESGRAGGPAESADPLPLFSLLNWARQTGRAPPAPPHPLLCSPPVPTVPPGNVHAEATNSTTIRFTWNAPSPQFINGINQGYKVREAGPCPEGNPGGAQREAQEREGAGGRHPSASEIIGLSQAEDM